MDAWTTKRLAAAAGLAQGYIRTLILAGKIPAVKFGNTWAISNADARAFLEWYAENKPKRGPKGPRTQEATSD